MQDCWSYTFSFSEFLTHCRNVASLSLFYSHYFVRRSAKYAEMFPHLRETSTRYSARLHDFLSPVLDVIRMSVSSLVPSSPRLEFFACRVFLFDL